MTTRAALTALGIGLLVLAVLASAVGLAGLWRQRPAPVDPAERAAERAEERERGHEAEAEASGASAADSLARMDERVTALVREIDALDAEIDAVQDEAARLRAGAALSVRYAPEPLAPEAPTVTPGASFWASCDRYRRESGLPGPCR